MDTTAKSYKVTILPGDGIGREIVSQAVRVLKVIGKRYNTRFSISEAPIGGTAIDSTGVPLPDETLKIAMSSDAILLGAVGGPRWDDVEYSIRPEQALLKLRKSLDIFANLRPAKLFTPLADASTLKRDVIEGTDILVVRELTGGIYFGTPRGIEKTDTGERGINTEVYTTSEVERISRVAFDIARRRHRRLCSVDKANVLESSALWRKVVTQIHREYEDVDLTHMYVDNCAMQLIRDPKQFDVIVTTNMFGDILSDEAAMLIGSIGMLPSASIGGNVNLYEPIHGSAPDIAGKDKANPIATILAVAMMLKYSFGMDDAGEEINKAVNRVLEKGYRTQDICFPGNIPVGTVEMTDLIIEELHMRE